MGKLINIIPGSRLLISRLTVSASRTLVELLSKPRDSISVLESITSKLSWSVPDVCPPWHNCFFFKLALTVCELRILFLVSSQFVNLL